MTNRAIIDGSRLIPAGSWAPHETLPGVYQADVTHEVETVPGGGAALFYCQIWAGDAALPNHFDGETIAANVAAVGAQPGSFTAHKIGSTTPDVREDTGSTDYRYFVHLADGGDPRGNGVEISYAEQVSLGSVSSGTWRNLELRRSGQKDLCQAGGGNNIPVYGYNILFKDAACHGPVGGPAHWTDCEAYGLPSSRANGGGGFHFYHNEEIGGPAPPSSAVRCLADGFRSGFYSHGHGTGPQEETVHLLDCDAVDCEAAITEGWSVDGWLIEGFVATTCRIFAEVAAATIKASATRRSSYLSEETGNCVGFSLWGDVDVEDTDLVFQTSGTAYLYSANPPDAETFYTLTLTGVTSQGAIGPASSSARQVDLVLIDSDVGELCASNGAAYPFRSLVASGSTFGLGGRSLATIQADHAGVDGTNTII